MGAVGIPLLLALYTRGAWRRSQVVGMVQAVVAGGSISALIALSDGGMAEVYSAGLMLVFFYVFTLLRLRFTWAVTAGVLNAASFEVAVWLSYDSLPRIVAHNSFVLSALLLGVGACYLLESHARGEFLRATQLEREVSRREEMEATQARLREHLEQSQKLESLGSLAGGVAHDFNNLLTGIVGYVQLAREGLDPDSAPVRDLDDVLLASHRAKELTVKLLAFSRKEVRDVRVVDVPTLLTEVERMLRPLIREDISLELELCQEPCRVRADTNQLERVLLNLMTNARDAMPTGGRLRISVSTVDLAAADCERLPGEAAPGPYALIEVEDTGQGMGPAVLERIFEPFFTTKDRGRGTGLGLSSLYGIVTQGGEVVDVRSAPGQGTAFRVYLPRTTDSLESPPDPQRRSTLSGHETVLLVEDQAMVRGLAERVLRNAGYEVLAAPSGQAALALVTEYPGEIGLLVTDIVMPGMSGAVLTENLREVRPRLRFLWMSGYPDDVLSQHMGSVPAGVRFLAKPFSTEGLLTAVREVLDA